MDCPQDNIELQAAALVHTARQKSDTDACQSNAALATYGDADSEEPLEHFNFQADGTASSKYRTYSCRTSDSSPVDDSNRNAAPDESPDTRQVSLPGVADTEEHAKPSDPIDAGSPSASDCQGPPGNEIKLVDNDERNDPPLTGFILRLKARPPRCTKEQVRRKHKADLSRIDHVLL